MAESLIEFRADLIRDLVARGYKVTGAAAAPLTPEVLALIRALGAGCVPLPLPRAGINPLLVLSENNYTTLNAMPSLSVGYTF